MMIFLQLDLKDQFEFMFDANDARNRTNYLRNNYKFKILNGFFYINYRTIFSLRNNKINLLHHLNYYHNYHYDVSKNSGAPILNSGCGSALYQKTWSSNLLLLALLLITRTIIIFCTLIHNLTKYIKCRKHTSIMFI